METQSAYEVIESTIDKRAEAEYDNNNDNDVSVPDVITNNVYESVDELNLARVDDNEEERQWTQDDRSSDNGGQLNERDDDSSDADGRQETAEAFGDWLKEDESMQLTNNVESDDESVELRQFSAQDNEAEDNTLQRAASPVSPASPASPVSPVQNNTYDAAPEPEQRSAAPPPSSSGSGKFVLRSSRQAGAEHFIETIRHVATPADDSIERRELVTILRSTIDGLDERKPENRASVVKTQYVKSYETHVITGMANPEGTSAGIPEIKSYVSYPTRRPTPAVATSPVLQVAPQTMNDVVEEQEQEPVQAGAQLAISSEQPEKSTRLASVSSPEAVSEAHNEGQLPTWVTAAIEKQKRSADVIQQLEKPSNETESSTLAPPPWTKDRKVKRVVPPTSAPLVSPSPAPVAVSTLTVEATVEQSSAPAAASPTAAATISLVEKKTEQPTNQSLQWLAEVENRKKLKSYIISQKPVEPLRLGTVPEWKKQLNEKVKRGQSVDAGENRTIVSPGPKPAGDTPWQREVAQLKKMSVSSPEEEESRPEWLRIAEEAQKNSTASS